MKPIATAFIPQDSVNDETVLIVALSKCDGDCVVPGESILDYETSKAVKTLESESSGYIAYCCVESANVAIGGVVAAFFNEWDESAVALWKESLLNSVEPMTMPNPETGGGLSTQYSYRAEALIAEKGLDKRLFVGTDFVSVHDVEKILSPSHDVVRLAPLSSRRKSPVGDRERVVVICANQTAAEMIQDIIADDPGKTIVGYVVDSAYRYQADLPYLDSDVFEFPEKISRNDFDSVIIAMGGSLQSMRFRKKVFEHYRTQGISFANVISNSANIASGVRLGVGNVIEGNVYIGPHAQILDNNFISYATIIGHHSSIGSHNLFAPGVTMAGLVTIGDDCILPTGVNFIDRVKVGHRVIVPVGHNIISDLKDDTVLKMKGIS